MTTHRRLATVALAAVLIGAGGCSVFEDRPRHRDDGRGSGRDGGSRDDEARGNHREDRCDVNLDQWKQRVERFKDKKYRNKSNFRQTKDDLVRDLERLDTAGCQREIRREVNDLIDEVRAERY